MKQAQKIDVDQRRASIRALEGLFLSSFMGPTRCRICNQDGREAEIHLAQGAEPVWIVSCPEGCGQTYSSIPEILAAGWYVE